MTPTIPLLLLLSLIQISYGYDWTCNLHCFHGGTCRHGHGKFGSYAGIEEDEEMPWDKQSHKNGMYCTCPVGYTGLQCEIAFVVCGADDHTCFNGSRCKKDVSGDNKVYWRCECDVKNSDMSASYAGKFCEHESTVFCHGNGAGFSHGTSFCVNGGKCKEAPDSAMTTHIGCICPEGWEGAHCETAVKGFSMTAVVQSATGNKSVGSIIGIVIGCFIAVALGLYVKEQYMDKPKRERERHAGTMLGLQQEMASQRKQRNKLRSIV